jgi:ABC-type transporter Mla subunit MlaD
VGTFIISVAVLLLVTVVIIGRGKDWFKKYTTYYTVFDEGYNLQPDTSVKLFSANLEKGSHDIPRVTQSAAQGIHEIRGAVDNIDKVVKSLKKNFLIKPNLSPEPEAENVDAGLRP